MEPRPTTVIRMPPQRWKPTTDEQCAVIAKLDELAAKAKEMWGTIDAARKLGVPKDVIAEHVKPAASRATVYRRLGKTQPDGEEGASSA